MRNRQAGVKVAVTCRQAAGGHCVLGMGRWGME
jgi:hypothetical protein